MNSNKQRSFYKVLLISPLAPPQGGMATWTNKYMKYCEDNGIVVKNVNTALIGKRGKKINDKSNIFDEFIRTKNIFTSLKNNLKEDKYDIIHLNSSCSFMGIYRDLIISMIVQKTNSPLVIEIHCNLEYELNSRIKRFAFRLLSSYANEIIVLNRKSYDCAKKLSKTSISILPNFIDEDYLISKRNINSEIKKIVYVGHVQKTKGCEELLMVAARNINIDFYFVGPVSDDISYDCKLDNVFFEGNKDYRQVKEYFLEADLFVFPSYTEGFSMSMLEAMALGLPIIASDVGANRDMIENHGGIIVPVKNADAIDEAIKSMEAQCIREEMSEWNINKVREQYTVGNVLKCLIDRYSCLLNDLN